MERPGPNEAEQAFADQDDDEAIVEIDENGNVYRPDNAPLGTKTTILRDPKGEYWHGLRSVHDRGQRRNKPGSRLRRH